NHVSSKAFLAAWTARSTSSAVALGTSARTSPVAGEVIVWVSPDDESSHSPPTNILCCFTVVATSPTSGRRSLPAPFEYPAPDLGRRTAGPGKGGASGCTEGTRGADRLLVPRQTAA